jgi:DNA-binding transcriptional MerR regulator
MRIGEFAQKHDTTQDTIRYYLDMGLLVAEKSGTQYKFSEADSRDLSRILELKQLDFSLTEIQKILMFQRLSGSNTEVFRNMYLSFLEEKKNEVEKELLKYNKMNDYLKNKIHEIKIEGLREKRNLGFPMASLGILVCPLCGHSLDVSDGTIEKNMVMDANIQCECGYKAVIQNGIYVDETAVRVKMINGKKMPTKEEYLASCSHTYVNFLYRGMASLIKYIGQYASEPKYILELDNCVGFFLMQYIKYLPKTSTYILVDYDKERIAELKRNLEMYYDHKNFMFLCCDLHRLPVASSTVDVVVDYMMSARYGETTGESLVDKVMPLLKQNGIYTMSCLYFGANSKINPIQASKAKGCFNKDKMIDKLTASNLSVLDTMDIGPIFKDDIYETNINGIELYQSIYSGRKSIVHDVKPKVKYIKTPKKMKIWG